MNFANTFITIGQNNDLLRRYFRSLIVDRLGLEYNQSTIEQIDTIEAITEKAMNTLSEREKPDQS